MGIIPILIEYLMIQHRINRYFVSRSFSENTYKMAFFAMQGHFNNQRPMSGT